MEEKDDLPKSIVVVLVVLAVAISILSTFTVLNEVNRLNNAPVYEGRPVQSGKISLTVQNPKDALTTATGKVFFEIQKSEVN